MRSRTCPIGAGSSMSPCGHPPASERVQNLQGVSKLWFVIYVKQANCMYEVSLFCVALIKSRTNKIWRKCYVGNRNQDCAIEKNIYEHGCVSYDKRDTYMYDGMKVIGVTYIDGNSLF